MRKKGNRNVEVIARWGQKHVIIYTLKETTQAAGAVETFESRQWITPLLYLFEKPAQNPNTNGYYT